MKRRRRMRGEREGKGRGGEGFDDAQIIATKIKSHP